MGNMRRKGEKNSLKGWRGKRLDGKGVEKDEEDGWIDGEKGRRRKVDGGRGGGGGAQTG